jgi:hypothetical protein
MKLRFEFAAGPRVLRAVFEGVLDDKGLRHAYQELKRYVRATDPAVGIWDMSGVTELAITSETVRELGRAQPALPQPEVPRFIVTPTDHAFGMARMFQEIGDATRPQLKVVRSLQEVYDQVGIAPPGYEPVPPPGVCS